MSTTKIVAAGAAAVVILLGLSVYAYHRAHALPRGVVWQAPSGYRGQLRWNVPLASDQATQQAEQQIQAQLAVFAQGLTARDVNTVMSLDSPGAPTHAEARKVFTELFSQGPVLVNGVATSITVTGNTAIVQFANGGLTMHVRRGSLRMPHAIFEKTGSQWLFKDL